MTLFEWMLKLQIVNGLSQRLLVGFDVAPDVLVALVAGRLTSVVHPFLLSQLAEQSVSRDVRRYFDVLLLVTVGIGLAGDAADDCRGLASGEPPAAAAREQGTGSASPQHESLVQHLTCIALHGHEVSELAALDLNAGKALAGILVVVWL